MKPILSTTILTLFLALGVALNSAHAEEPPSFIQESFPAHGVDAAWESYKAVFLDPEGVLDAKTKELMALSVSAQVPCTYCIYYHTEAARAHGATQEEIQEALAVASMIRKWSTILNGVQYDEEQWRSEVDEMFASD